MMKPKLTRSLVLVCLLTAFYACTTKNEVPTPVVDTARVDALRTQLTKTVSYTVTVGSFLFHPLKGATVSLTQGGKIVTATTSSSGAATFNGLYAGVITATVDLPNFARLVFRADIRNNYDQANQYSTGSTVLMLPLLGGTAQADSCMTTAYFKLYANYSILDDTLGGQTYWGASTLNQTTTPAATIGPNINSPTISYSAVTNQSLTASLRGQSFEDQNAVTLTIPAGFTTGNGNGEVKSVSYENAKWTATVNAVTGVYTLKLPATDVSNNGNWNSEYPSTSNIIDFDLEFGEFTSGLTQYSDGSVPYIQNNSNPAIRSFTETYIYRLGSYDWLSSQTTTATQATPWPFFYNYSLK